MRDQIKSILLKYFTTRGYGIDQATDDILKLKVIDDLVYNKQPASVSFINDEGNKVKLEFKKPILKSKRNLD